MRVTPYQYNIEMLREAQRVIHQQNLKAFEKLNRQLDEKHKVQCAKQVLKTNSVDVYV
jgi:hypothetical protein